MVGFGQVNPVKHFFGRLACEPGDVGQTALGIGHFARQALELVGQAQCLQGVVQLACERPNAVVDVRVHASSGVLGGVLSGVLGGVRVSFSGRVSSLHGPPHFMPYLVKIRLILSSSVAFVKGLTIKPAAPF